jgi:hypothetical protein
MLVMSKFVYHITNRTQTKAHVAHVPISLALVEFNQATFYIDQLFTILANLIFLPLIYVYF